MFATTSNPTLLEKDYLGHLLAFLDLSGWKIIDRTLKWYELHGSEDINGEPLTLILPSSSQLPQADSYIEKAVDMLNALADEPIELTIQRIKNYFSDIFVVSNLETGTYQSISIGLAATQINSMKSLIVYGARTERHPRPYFHNHASGREHVLEMFRFGHTVKGSFGLTVEAPIVHDLELFERDEKQQLPLFPELNKYILQIDIQIPPIERRIMERLVRGLMITHRATREHTITPIVNQYGSGFSGNMCDAIIDIAKGESPIEYRVLWSPKIPVSQDVAEFESIRLDETSYQFLKEAIKEMKVVEPQFERIRGVVTHVGSTVAPLSEAGDGRTVIVRRILDDERRSHNIVIPLNKEQYLRAHKAHLEWSTIEVTGIVQRVGTGYRLVDARDLVISNPR